jgi:hypothetical protein
MNNASMACFGWATLMRAEIRRRQKPIDDYRAGSNPIYARLGIIVAIMAVAVAIYALVRHEWFLSIIKY